MAFTLPDAPESVRQAKGPDGVWAWEEPVVIPTYLPMPPDKNPMFLDKRVYQGSSGKVYPLPFIDRISDKKDRAWQAIHIENKYVRLMILPELGGRIHVGLDKTNGYDFFYRQNVIKPALVGLAGPWISGGVEFNWPQHHRPSTFMPVDTHIEGHADGSVTVWCSEHEPMTRMKGMHGVHLRPDSSLIELKVKVYNRTDLPQTFLWWANVAARVHERYQSFFPPDVTYVADHAKRAMSTFPLCTGKYYGVDYGGRSQKPEVRSQKDDKSIRFPPTGEYPPNDLSWYANIPVPTSYMAMGSKEDFFGGYDHKAGAGFVHIADHHIAPGKKQWTWGNHPFGYAWDRNLTEPEAPGEPPAPYIELMAGVYTDNQPDFSWLMPGEVREWSQYWYPIQKVGPVKAANNDAALSFEPSSDGATARLGVAATAHVPSLLISVTHDKELVWEKVVDVRPDAPVIEQIRLPKGFDLRRLRVDLMGAGGTLLLRWELHVQASVEIPPSAKEPGLPESIETSDELYAIGLHLEQYRHATRSPEVYWREALRRDPGDVRSNNALGLWHLKRGEFELAVERFQAAISTLTKFNPNPRDGEPFYNLGIALFQLNRLEDAREVLKKVLWNRAHREDAAVLLAQVRSRLGMPWNSLSGLSRNDSAKYELLKALEAVRALGRSYQEISSNYLSGPFEFWEAFLKGKPLAADLQTRLDIALDFANAGFYEEAIELLKQPIPESPNTNFQIPRTNSPLPAYYIAYFYEKFGKPEAAHEARLTAAAASPDYCFPHRLEEIAILQEAIDKNPGDARAPYYLGNLFYDKGRREEAITLWELVVQRDRSFPTAWRNLGLAYYNARKDIMPAKGAYQRALKNSFSEDDDGNLTGGDARILYERDQLWRRAQHTAKERLDELEQYPDLIRQRDDLTLEYCSLLNQVKEYDAAIDIMKARNFQPWEGGEGVALATWARAHIALGRQALWRAPADGGNPALARQHFEAALHPPESLGEAWHPLQNLSEIHYWLGKASAAVGDQRAAELHFQNAAESQGDFQGMSTCEFSEMSYYTALALRELGRHEKALALLTAMLDFSQTLATQTPKIDYFATSLPTMLIFEEDIAQTHLQRVRLLEALARHGLSEGSAAPANPQEKRAARRLLGDLLQADPGHALASDLLLALDWS